MTRVRIVTVLAVLLAGCGTAALAGGQQYSSLQITRTPGLFILPPVNVTITDPATVNRLLADINALPPFPAGTLSCPADFGTSYKLVFRAARAAVLTAVVSVQGCRGVTVSDGRNLWALSSDRLFSDLGAALGLSQDELIPVPCAPGARTVCYPQPSLP